MKGKKCFVKKCENLCSIRVNYISISSRFKREIKCHWSAVFLVVAIFWELVKLVDKEVDFHTNKPPPSINFSIILAGIKSIGIRLAHHETTVKPINEPPNDHLTFRPAILDDLPVPEGDWLEDYKKRQRKYWMHFFMGLTALSSTIYIVSVLLKVIFTLYRS